LHLRTCLLSDPARSLWFNIIERTSGPRLASPGADPFHEPSKAWEFFDSRKTTVAIEGGAWVLST